MSSRWHQSSKMCIFSWENCIFSMSCTFHYLGSLMRKSIKKTSKFETNLGAKIKKKPLKNRVKDEYPCLIDFGPIFAPFGGSLGTILGPCWEILVPKMGVHHCSTPLLFEMQLQKWQNFTKFSILDRFGPHLGPIFGPFGAHLGSCWVIFQPKLVSSGLPAGLQPNYLQSFQILAPVPIKCSEFRRLFHPQPLLPNLFTIIWPGGMRAAFK